MEAGRVTDMGATGGLTEMVMSEHRLERGKGAGHEAIWGRRILRE